jgi:hypothetical protein
MVEGNSGAHKLHSLRFCQRQMDAIVVLMCET